MITATRVFKFLYISHKKSFCCAKKFLSSKCSFKELTKLLNIPLHKNEKFYYERIKNRETSSNFNLVIRIVKVSVLLINFVVMSCIIFQNFRKCVFYLGFLTVLFLSINGAAWKEEFHRNRNTFLSTNCNEEKTFLNHDIYWE